jgi:uncharacterized protein (UPF0548 family)
MFSFTRPTDERILEILTSQQNRQYSYSEVGASRGELPPGYKVLHDRVELGSGSAQFARASEALHQWKMFEVPGVQLCWPTTPVQIGNVVAVLIKHYGFWSLNFCRIVYLLDDEENSVRRLGFAYGTLAEHAEQGEERFTVEWDRSSDVVSYDILSFSQPGDWKTWIAYPVARRLQRHFVAHSLMAMVREVQQEQLTDLGL